MDTNKRALGSGIEDPRQFGVVKVNETARWTGFVKKPETFVTTTLSALDYFKDGDNLKKVTVFTR